ncbi:MAG: Rne/Rng family ribonuclease [Actinomycetota bacterium]
MEELERSEAQATAPSLSRSDEVPATGPSTGPTNDGLAAGPSTAPRKRRRGKRGGKRHRRKPAAAAAPGSVESQPDASSDATTKAQPEPAQAQSTEPVVKARAPRTEPRTARPAEDAPVAEPGPASSTGAAGGTTGTAQRRRRRRGGRGRGTGSGPRPAPKAPDSPAAEPPSEAQAAPQAEPSARPAEGQTRIAARQQRRDQRPRRPRRRLSDTEARALRGEAKTMLIHDHEDRTQIAVLEKGALIEHYVAHQRSRTIVGNVYLGKVQNVLPGMEAAFVDVGRGRNAVLYAGEVNYAAEDLEGEAPRIEKILKPGQAVMVQVTKDALGTKGARLTAQISIAGRYLVLAPEQAVSGISRRLSEDERTRLRNIFRDIRPKDHGIIVRTAAEGASREALERDLRNLLKVWDEITKNRATAKAPELLYAEPELTMRVVRDIFSGDFERVIVDSRGMFDTIHSYLEEQAPDLIERVELHEGPLPLLEQHHVTEQIHKALERKVWLPSGGSLVIDRTEALTVIDVNTGKFVGKGGSLEDTVLKNNLEAAEEVARQLRLRDIGGIIVIDFIDMLLPQNRDQVLRTLKRALGRDKTRSQVFEVSSLGLVEMTRKRVSEGLLDAFSEPCPNCDGRGIVITHEID